VEQRFLVLRFEFLVLGFEFGFWVSRVSEGSSLCLNGNVWYAKAPAVAYVDGQNAKPKTQNSKRQTVAPLHFPIWNRH
jgi:hypothetical protein